MEDLRNEIETLKAQVDSQNALIGCLMALQAREIGKGSVDQLFGVIAAALSSNTRIDAAGRQRVTESIKSTQQMTLSIFEGLSPQPEPLPTSYDQGVEEGLRAILLAIIMNHPNKDKVISFLRLGSDGIQSRLLFADKDNERYQLGLGQTLELLLSALDKEEGRS